MAITVYTYNDKVLKNVATDKWLKKKPVLPPIPANTVRVRTNDGNPPIKDTSTIYETATLVTGTTDIYDVYNSGTSFSYLLYKSTNVIEVLGSGDLSNIMYMREMFSGCRALTTVALFDTSNVTMMLQMFDGCTSLTSVPLFNTSKVTNINYAFSNCTNVESGALALYQQMSTQANPPANHSGTFSICGYSTVTGLAELQQIPTSWGGLAS